MSIGMILLIAVALLIVFGTLQRVLDRMGLTDRQALLCAAAIFVGGWLPDLTFGLVSVNIGGALIPLLVCLYLFFFKADTAKERVRALVAALLTAAAVSLIARFFPADPVAMPFDPMLLYGAAGGAVAWLLGRSRRCAFIAGVLGLLLSDVAVAVMNWRQGIAQTLHLGSAGALDAAVLSGIVSVLLCELFGELMERIATGPAAEGAIEGGHRA